MIEIAISIAAILLILFVGRQGAVAGFFVQMVTTGLSIFALLVALRYWFPMSVWMAGAVDSTPQDMAFAGFWVLFAIVFVPLYGLLRSLNERVIPAYPVVIDRAFGFIAGCVQGAILATALMTSLLLYLPKVWPGYEAARMLVPLDRGAVAFYRGTESTAGNLGFSENEEIVFPVTGKTNDGALTVKWE